MTEQQKSDSNVAQESLHSEQDAETTLPSAANDVGQVAETVTPGLEPFVAGFFEDRKKDFLQLKAFIQDSDYSGAHKIAHNWKGYCEPYGFSQLGLLAAQLEKALALADHEAISGLLVSMDEYLIRKQVSAL